MTFPETPPPSSTDGKTLVEQTMQGRFGYTLVSSNVSKTIICLALHDEEPPLTRSRISELTELSLPSVSRGVKFLRSFDLVKEYVASSPESSPGRPTSYIVPTELLPVVINEVPTFQDQIEQARLENELTTLAEGLGFTRNATLRMLLDTYKSLGNPTAL